MALQDMEDPLCQVLDGRQDKVDCRLDMEETEFQALLLQIGEDLWVERCRLDSGIGFGLVSPSCQASH
jgi:hypothetical protein